MTDQTANGTVYIRSTLDSDGRAACLLTWGTITKLLTPEAALTTARELTAAAAAAESDVATIESFRATLKADMRTIGLMVLDIRKRRPMPKGRPALRIASVAGVRTGKPLVHIALGSMKGELDPDEARTMALHWTQTAVAAQIDVRLRYALGEWDKLTPTDIERLFAIVQRSDRGADRE
ncbi:hypothetical protein [Streptomyces sp. NPDC047070]|uniref:hypothetical protein n=1 Tax=Streptomyces sp. NPDC047070 TaxID=3154923 RepID=UPI003456C420